MDDSPRWCTLCEKWGDHGTRQHIMSPRELLVVETLRTSLDKDVRRLNGNRRGARWVVTGTCVVLALLALVAILWRFG